MSAGCFSPYMLISSTLQTVFGFDRRSEQEQQAESNRQFQIKLQNARERFQQECEDQKIVDMRARMAIARQYRSEERFEQTVLQHRTSELETFFKKYLPIGEECIPALLTAADDYRSAGYDTNCPLNVILLHTRQAELNYNEICDALEKTEPCLGNIVYRRWCDKDVSHNSGILNLHAIMGNIPTVVVSPFYQCGAIHFNASMWEAQSETKPLIRPLFTVKCPQEYLGIDGKFTAEGKKAIQKKITFITTILAGCARDSYMLMTQGLPPTLPSYLKGHPDVLKTLLDPSNKDVLNFVLDEYGSAKSLLAENDCASGLLEREQMSLLASIAEGAEKEITKITSSNNR